MAVERRCEWCGKPLTKHLKRFCSRTCYSQWQEKNYHGENNPAWKGGNVLKICKWCGRKFEKAQSKASRKFCSRACFIKFMRKKMSGKNHPRWRKRVQIICAWCGNKFEAAPSLAHQKFCSRKCWATSWMMAEKNEETCLWCGKKFEARPAEQRKFCSQERMGLWRSTYLQGEQAPNWRGGLSLEPYGPEWTEELKEEIRKRDNYTCAISGEVWQEGGPNFHVHHIDYDKRNSVPTNLVTLAPDIHMKINANRQYWQALLTPIAQKAEKLNAPT